MKRTIDFHLALIIIVVLLGSTIFLIVSVTTPKEEFLQTRLRAENNQDGRLENNIKPLIQLPLKRTGNTTSDIQPVVFSIQPTVINPETEKVIARIAIDLYLIIDLIDTNLWNRDFIIRIWNQETGRQLDEYQTSLNQWFVTNDYKLVKTFSIPVGVFLEEEREGTYTATSYLDFTNRIPEYNETNNQIQTDFEVYASIPLQPNFAIESVTMTNANTGLPAQSPFKKGDVIAAQINARNISNIPGQVCRFELGVAILSNHYPQWVYKESFSTFIQSGAVISSPLLYIAFVDDGPTELLAQLFNTSVAVTCQETEYDDNYYSYGVFDVGP